VDENALLKEMDVWTPTPEKGYGNNILDYSYELQAADVIADDRTILEIGYTNRSENYAYIPYFADIMDEGLKEKLSVQADAEVIRRMTCDSVQMHMVSPQKAPMKLPSISYRNKLWENYSTYALNHYTQVTADGINRITQLADTWRSEGNAAENMSKVGDTAYDKPIARVRKELLDTTNYSRNLDAVPIGKDVVENFLFDSKQGYCIHYASAATLLLRSLGVPTRYVEGYAIKPEDFKENDDGTYTALALDYDGHAWAEIYSSVRGWIPIEVTKGSPGSGTEVSNTIKDPSTIASEQAKKANASNTTQNAAQANQTATQNQKKSTASGFAINWKQILKYAGLYALLVGIVVGLGYLLWIRTRGVRKRMYLRRHFASHDSRKAELAYSYAIYQQLLRAGVLKDKHLWDDDYEIIVREKLRFMNQEELERFLDCAKKTAFSDYQPTLEEVEEGRIIYHKICEAIREGRISK
jgi:transglutaminase-like putative cysteine protease